MPTDAQIFLAGSIARRFGFTWAELTVYDQMFFEWLAILELGQKEVG